MNISNNTPQTPLKTGISSFVLKVVAIACMTLNHGCYIFYDRLSFETICMLFWFGGLTFPIMAFLLVEGYYHTSNIRRYAWRLLIFAFISQVPYTLFLGNNFNVLFTLFIGIVILYLYDNLRSRVEFWFAAAALIALSALCDWGILGPSMILMMHIIPHHCKRVIYPLLLPILSNGLPALSAWITEGTLSLLPFVLYPFVGCTAAIPLLLIYNSQRGKPMKWFFYAYYPAHILILGMVREFL